jgi:hypothetical protein
LGAEIALGQMKALIDFRYYMGLTNCFSQPDLIGAAMLMEPPPDWSMKNAAFILTAGIIF